MCAPFFHVDPATGEEIGKVPDMGVEETKEAINIASAAFKVWSNKTAKERHDIMKKWYDLMMANQDDLATILTWENGKSLVEARGEIVYGSSFIEWFAEEAVRAYGAVIPSNMPNQRYITIKQPVGVVGIITPWSKYSFLNRRVMVDGVLTRVGSNRFPKCYDYSQGWSSSGSWLHRCHQARC